MMVYENGISVAVVNYRTPHDLKNFVDSYVFQESEVDSDLIVIDVDPTEESYDESKEILSKYDFQFQYWPIMHNCGYSGACNFASSMSNREVMGFFNADTKLFDDTLDLCHSALKNNSGWAALGPLQTDSSGRVTHAGIFGTNSKPSLRGWRSKHPDQFRDVRDDAVSVSGSAYFVNKSIWDSLLVNKEWQHLYPGIEGVFLPTPHYYEETWYSYFARHNGYKVAYYGEAMMIHEWHKASPVGSVERSVMSESRSMFRAACDAIGIDHD